VTVLVVDGANVVGSRPDGWWRDRAGAAARLASRLATALAAGPSSTADVAASVDRVVLVLEGAARAASIRTRVEAVGAGTAGPGTLLRALDTL